MRVLVAFLLVTFAVVQAVDVKTEWNNYKAQFNKNYASVEEDEFRFKIFAENKQKIEEHNAKYEKGEVSYKLGLNQFSDLTAEEFEKIQGTRPRINNEVVKDFNDWKVVFNKNYASAEEEEFRFKIFAENKQKVEEHNAKYEKGEVSYKLGLNQFSDLTAEEFEKIQGTRPRINNEVVKDFNDWKVVFNKNYASAEEEEFRFKIFAENKQKVEEHNAKYEKGEVSYKLGLNQFSDLTAEEFEKIQGTRPRINNEVVKDFNDWKVVFNKNYASAEEEEFRFKIFAENKQKVEEHNAKYEKGEVSYKLSLNQFSDWTAEEFKKIQGLRPRANNDVVKAFNDWKAKFNKNYASVEEEEFRFKIFTENKQKVEEHNAKYEKGEVSYKLVLNQFSDWTTEEFKAIQGTKPRAANDIQKAFHDWKAKYNKNYASVEEEELRFKIFAETKKEVDEHNAKYEKGEVSWKQSLNQFSDWTQEEIKKILGLRPRANNDIQKAWNEYKVKYNKNYTSVEEDEFRFKIFAENKQKVDEHNAKYAKGEVTWEMGLNQFSDFTTEELREHLGFKPKEH